MDIKVRLSKQAEIVRAFNRDLQIRGMLGFSLREALELFFDYRKLSKHSNELKLLSDCIYVWLTTLRGNPTMGEEYCCIQPCSIRHYDAIKGGMKVKNVSGLFPSIPRRLAYMVCFVIVPYALSKIGERLYQ